MFARHDKPKATRHVDSRRDYYVADDGTIYPDIPLITGSAVEHEVRFVLAAIFQHFADQLSVQTQVDQPPQCSRVVDVTFESDLQSGSS